MSPYLRPASMSMRSTSPPAPPFASGPIAAVCSRAASLPTVKKSHASTAATSNAYAFSATSFHAPPLVPPAPVRFRDTTVQHAEASALPLSTVEPSGEYAIVVTKIMCAPRIVFLIASVLTSTSRT